MLVSVSLCFSLVSIIVMQVCFQLFLDHMRSCVQINRGFRFPFFFLLLYSFCVLLLGGMKSCFHSLVRLHLPSCFVCKAPMIHGLLSLGALALTPKAVSAFV